MTPSADEIAFLKTLPTLKSMPVQARQVSRRDQDWLTRALWLKHAGLVRVSYDRSAAMCTVSVTLTDAGIAAIHAAP